MTGQIRVTHGANQSLTIRHGAQEVGTIKRALGGGVRVKTADREWRLTTTDDGWTAAGDPPAHLRTRWLRGAALTIGDHALTASKRRVHGPTADLRFHLDKSGAKPVLRGEIERLPQSPEDATAVVVLATTAVLLDADLSTAPNTNLNGDNVSAAVRYAPGI